MALSRIGGSSAAATTITIPAHSSGDLLVMWAYKNGATSIPTVPSAGGTVPTWNTIDGPTGANLNAAVCCWAIGTGSSTSGTWTGATGLSIEVWRGQATTPIGGHAQSGSTASSGGSLAVPAVTPRDVSGTSVLLNFAGWRTVTAWTAPPGGYTQRSQVATQVEAVTKDSSTTDGTFNLSGTASGNGGYRTQQIEILVLNGPPVVTRPSVLLASLRSLNARQRMRGLWRMFPLPPTAAPPPPPVPVPSVALGTVRVTYTHRRGGPSYLYPPALVQNPAVETDLHITLAARQARRRTTHFQQPPTLARAFVAPPIRTHLVPRRPDWPYSSSYAYYGPAVVNPAVTPSQPPVVTTLAVHLLGKTQRRRTTHILFPPQAVVPTPAQREQTVRRVIARRPDRRRTTHFLFPPQAFAAPPVVTQLSPHFAAKVARRRTTHFLLPPQVVFPKPFARPVSVKLVPKTQRRRTSHYLMAPQTLTVAPPSTDNLTLLLMGAGI